MPSGFEFAPDAWSLFLVAPAVLSLWLAAETSHRKYGRLGREFSLLMAAIGWWSATYALELAAVGENGMRFWLKAEYAAIPFVPVLMYRVVRGYLDLPPLEGFLRIGIWLVPVATLVLQVTNESHFLFYSAVEVLEDEHGSRLSLEPGPWYWVDAAYAYLLGAAAVFHLVRRFPGRGAPVLRRQSFLLVLAVIGPFVGFTLYAFHWFPVRDLDLTPYFFFVSGVTMAVGIFGFRLFDVVPVALERVFERIGDACVVFDRRGRIVRANGSAIRLFGWGELPFGRAADEAFRGFPALSSCLRDLGTVSVSLAETVDGEERHWQVTRSGIEDGGGREAGSLLVVRDDTERVRLTAELREMVAEKDRLFSIIGHDLRGSIAGLEGLGDLLAEDGSEMDDEEIRDLARSMSESAAATRGLLENLLLWARLERGDLRREMVPTGLGQVVEGVRTQLAASLAHKSIRLETDFADEAKVVLADRRLLEVVLRNLVSNAVKFSPSGGRVGLASFAENPDGIAIEVRDEGIGMSRDLVDNLWSLTARKGRPGTAGEPSSGLGLVLVKEAVQAMEGRIAVESREGEGTVFRIHLRGAREAPEPEPAIRGGG